MLLSGFTPNSSLTVPQVYLGLIDKSYRYKENTTSKEKFPLTAEQNFGFLEQYWVMTTLVLEVVTKIRLLLSANADRSCP